MRNVILGILFFCSFAANAEQTSIKERAKTLLEDYARVDAADWYNKGDTTFAENDGFIGVYRHLKASVRDDAVNIKMNFVSGAKTPDSDDFSRKTTDVCITIFSQLIYPYDEEETWDEAPAKGKPSPDYFAFMRESELDKIHGQKKEAVIEGWNISIKRTALLTTCSAQKI